MEYRISFWQTRITITQAPEPFKPKVLPENNLPSFHQSDRSFLYDPFGGDSPATYGLELCSNENVELTFFTKAESESEGIEIGSAWLSNLKHRFVGLDGNVVVKPIYTKDLKEQHDRNLLEIILPVGFLTSKINVIERFIKAFYYLKDHFVQLFILWQEEPRISESQERLNSYNLKFFLNYELNNSDIKEHSNLKGILKFLSMDIETNKGKRASLVKPSDVSLQDILEGNIFNNNKDFLKQVVQDEVNFDFPENLPLPRLPILENENVRYIDINTKFKKRAISIGKHIKEGVITNHITYVPINKLPQDLAIFGKSGSGKTYFLAKFISELSNKAKNVGILVLNVAKASQEIFYKGFLKIKYSDDDFQIPYFIEGEPESLNKCLQETATYICASLGLKNVFEKIIYRTKIGFMNLKGALPQSFMDLLRGVERYIINNPYGPEEQANLLQVFRNRMNVFDEQKIQKVLKLMEKLPDWVISWLNGKNIFLDLSMCNKFIKMLIVNAIFQLVRTLTKDNEAEELKYLIVIDEAHAILEKPITTNSDDADFIMKEQMAKIFSELLKEYRSRGVGFVIADQSPARLFDDVVSQPSIKVIFREDYPNNLLFSEDPFERQIFTQLPNRLALVINGATGEKYLIKTLDYTFLNFILNN